MNRRPIIAAVAMMSFNKSERTMYLEWAERNVFVVGSMSMHDVVAFVSYTGNQVVFVRKPFVTADCSGSVWYSQRLRVDRGRWDYESLRGAARLMDLRVSGWGSYLKWREEMIADLAARVANKIVGPGSC